MARTNSRARFRDTLASYLVGRRDPEGGRHGQGTIMTWDALTGANTVSFRGQTYTNMPFLRIGSAIPDYTGGDIVVIDGWAPNGRLSSWCIRGRVSVPPTT